MNLPQDRPVVILLGGGVESTALASRFLGESRRVIPVHVHCGFIWDECESLFVRRFCQARRDAGMDPLIEFRVPLAGWLEDHWAVTGERIPQAGDNGAGLEIPLRNLMLLSLTIPQVARTAATQLAVGTTAENNFRDSTREYFDRTGELISLEMGRPLEILTPYLELTKADVIRITDAETLAFSFSCVNPQQNRHCGLCIKCGSRRQAFADAEIEDPTDYVHT